MTPFLKKIALFSLFLIVASIAYYAFIIQFNQKKQDQTEEWIGTDGTPLKGFDYYIFGNSHPECAINDSLSKMSMKNLAVSGEPLFYSVSKMRRIAEKNPNATFIIEIGNHALHAIHWVLNDEHAYKNYRHHFYNLNLMEHEFMISNNTNKALKTILSLDPNSASSMIQGQYKPLNKSLKEYYQKQTVKLTTNRDDISETTYEYSSKLQEQNIASLKYFIQEYPNIQIILIRCPVHQSFENPNEQEYQQIIHEMTSKYGVRYVDFKDSLTFDAYFADPEHLNKEGAIALTQKLDIFLNQD